MKIFTSVPSERMYFSESVVEDGNFSQSTERAIINVYDDVVRQQMYGFGGAFTEAAAYNYSLMSDEQKDVFMRAYFDKETGIGYNIGRTHINSCDFSIDIYDYVETGDKTLESFDISREKKYVIPFIKDAMKYCKEELVLFASPWSPPAYMKDNGDMLCGGVLLEEYKAVWARYYVKYIKAFAAEGIKISAISVQNEPKAIQTWESCYYSPEDERDFIEKYLIAALDEAGLGDIKIIIWDHNKERVYDRARKILASEKVNSRVAAVGFHWYSGDHFDGVRLVHEVLSKPTLASEFCKSAPYSMAGDDICAAEDYAREMSGNFNSYAVASCDWNLMLDQNGGPYHNRTAKPVTVAGRVLENKSGGCYAPIIYDTKKGELILTPTYYYIGHFSRFIERGAKRVECTKYTDDLTVSAFVNPDGTRVAVIMNTADCEMPAIIRNNDLCTRIDMKPHSIITALF